MTTIELACRGLPYLLGEGLSKDGHQVLQGSFGVELAGVLRRAALLRRLPGERETVVRMEMVGW